MNDSISNFLIKYDTSDPYIKIWTLVAAGVVAFFVAIVLFYALRIILRRSIGPTYNIKESQFLFPFAFLFIICVLNIIWPAIAFPGMPGFYVHKLLFIAFVSSFSYMLMRIVQYIKIVVYEKNMVDTDSSLNNRKLRTQMDFLQKLITIFILIIAVSVILMSFERVRQFGTSILASAGLVGIIIGLAAQKSISNLLAGLQIAFTQPIRIDDMVVVENESGKIEEITLTYVVVQVWDNRRLIVPISYFLDKPFQNWTRTSSDLTGTVFLFVDYTTPINALREELSRIVHASKFWDGNVCALHVTEMNDKSLQIRIIASGNSAGNTWELRCEIREKMIRFIQENYLKNFPRGRNENITV